MKILFVLKMYPYPAISGTKMRTDSFVTALAGEHELSLLCTSGSDADDSSTVNPFKKIWYPPKQTNLPKIKKSSISHSIRGLLRLNSWEIENFDEGIERELLKITAEEKFDIIFCRYIGNAKYVIENKHKISGRLIVDLDDIEPVKTRRLINATIPKWTRGYYRALLNNYIFSRYHKKIKKASKCFVCSDYDREYVLSKRWAQNVEVIPNSVNISNYREVADLSGSIGKQANILFCGHLNYGPNIEGLLWFINHSWPIIKEKIPAAKLYVVGKAPGKRLYDVADNESIFLYGDVESVLPFYEISKISIVPLHVAGGTRIKILESFACRRPVVSTTIGAEGLNLEKNVNCMIADSPREFSSACISLLENESLSKTLIENAYKLVVDKFDSKAIASKILAAFNGAQ